MFISRKRHEKKYFFFQFISRRRRKGHLHGPAIEVPGGRLLDDQGPPGEATAAAAHS